MNPKLTDEAVAALPLASGRADLLEEIMRTPVTNRPTAPTPIGGRRRTRWLAPLAAAAAVAAVAGGSLWWAGSDDAATEPAAPTVATPSPGPAPYRAVLDAPGWKATYVNEEEGGGEVHYERGGSLVEIYWRHGSAYESYLEDRRDIVDPPADGDPVEVLGMTSQLWAYSAKDHTVIRPVESGHLLEVRGSGMRRPGFENLLGQLRLVGQADFEAALPAEFVTDAERADEINAMLDGIADVSSQLLPPGFDRSAITSDQTDRYPLGADVASGVACVWLDEFRAGTRLGDAGRAQAAVDALSTSRQWPVLLEMAETGEYPDMIWQYADEIAAGTVPQGYHEGLGCAR